MHSERNISRIPKAKRRRLTFAVTVTAPTGMALPQWQTFLHNVIQQGMIKYEIPAAETHNIVVKLLKTTTEYGGDDAES